MSAKLLERFADRLETLRDEIGSARFGIKQRQEKAAQRGRDIEDADAHISALDEAAELLEAAFDGLRTAVAL